MRLNFVSPSGFISGPSQTCINMCNAYSPNNGANCSVNILHSPSLLRFPYFLQLAVHRHFETEHRNKIFPSKNTHELMSLPTEKKDDNLCHKLKNFNLINKIFNVCVCVYTHTYIIYIHIYNMNNVHLQLYYENFNRSLMMAQDTET